MEIIDTAVCYVDLRFLQLLYTVPSIQMFCWFQLIDTVLSGQMFCLVPANLHCAHCPYIWLATVAAVHCTLLPDVVLVSTANLHSALQFV